MEMSQAARDALTANLSRELECNQEIEFAVLHGSFRDGGQYHDVDVAIWIAAQRIATNDHTRYALDLDADLTMQLGVTLDVQILNEAPLAFRYQALAGTPLVVRDRNQFDDIRARTWDDYFDFAPFRPGVSPR